MSGGKYGDLEGKCKKTIEHLKVDATRLRTGRAHAGMLEGVMVEYYGSVVPLIQMGMINVPEPRMITVQVYDGSAVDLVEKAIQKAELGLNPMRDGSLLRLAVPALNEERRKELVKKLLKLGEDSKIAIRSHRKEANDSIKKDEKDKKISQDDARKQTDEAQKITDKFIAEVDSVVAAKEKEILEK